MPEVFNLRCEVSLELVDRRQTLLQGLRVVLRSCVWEEHELVLQAVCVDHVRVACLFEELGYCEVSIFADARLVEDALVDVVEKRLLSAELEDSLVLPHLEGDEAHLFHLPELVEPAGGGVEEFGRCGRLWWLLDFLLLLWRGLLGLLSLLFSFLYDWWLLNGGSFGKAVCN
jgi:hypothetical protein